MLDKIHNRYVVSGMVSNEDASKYMGLIEKIERDCRELITRQNITLLGFDEVVFVCQYNNTVLCYEEKSIRPENIRRIVYAGRQCVTVCDGFIFIHSRIS